MTAEARSDFRNSQTGRSDSARRIIVTPEGVALPLILARRGARLSALALDLLILGTVFAGAFAALIYLAGSLGQPIGENPAKNDGRVTLQLLEILFVIGGFLLHNGWFLFFELGPRGATPGKRMLSIRVAARDGAPLRADMIIARNLLRDIELFLPLALIAKAAAGAVGWTAGGGAPALAAAGWFALFALFPFFNRDRLRAGDLIAGTWVVETQRQSLLPVMSSPAGAEMARSPTGYRFGEAELAIYGEHELQTLERVLRDDRADTLAAVAAAICVKIGWTAPGAAETRPFLQAFYTQLRARLESGMRLGKRKADKFAH